MSQRALLADRDPAGHDRLSQHLQGFGLEVTRVSSIEELVEQLLTAKIDIVFIDINLSAQDGESHIAAATGIEAETGAGLDAIIDMAQLIRGSGQTAPIIVCATQMSASDQARLSTQDCRLLWIPFDPTALKNLLEQSLKASKPEPLSTPSAGLDEAEFGAPKFHS